MSGSSQREPTPTGRNRFRTCQDGPLSRDEACFSLSLRSIVGTTTSSGNAFDALSDHQTFAYCAGPAVIVSQVDKSFNITQRLYRAKPNAVSTNTTTSFYSTHTPPVTPSKSRLGFPSKDVIGLYNSADHVPEIPGATKPASWNREATCVSLSRNGRFLAVGETGHNPRVLIFSTSAEPSSEAPLSILTDHTFGVRSLAFSKDSRWLCSLGNAHDGFILLYTVNARSSVVKLHSSNKCSNVTAVIWMGNNVVSIGPRHVKVWRVEHATTGSPLKGKLDIETSVSVAPGSPGPRTFHGRNCLLGPLLDGNFTCAVSLSEHMAVICTAQGEICVLDDSNRAQRLERVLTLDFEISSITFDESRRTIWVGGSSEAPQALTLDSLLRSVGVNAMSDRSQKSTSPPIPSRLDDRRIAAIGSIHDAIITITSEREICFNRVRELDLGYAFDKEHKRLPAHDTAALGACKTPGTPEWGDSHFLTYSSSGVILFWLASGECAGRMKLVLEDLDNSDNEDENELKILRVPDFGRFLISGDKRGFVQLSKGDGESVFRTQAHIGDVNGLALTALPDVSLVASCGRDRMIQVFQIKSESMDLIQTLDDHAAAIIDLAFTKDDFSLLSISSDRTIVVRKLVRDELGAIAFLVARVITLRASPTCFDVIPFEPDNLIVSTLDRHIHKYDFRSGRLLTSFKATDPSTGETTMISSIQTQKYTDGIEERCVMFGASSADRSIRIHDCSGGRLIFREQGQISASNINIISARDGRDGMECFLVSCGIDGTVLLWDVHQRSLAEELSIRSDSPLKQGSTPKQVLRRTLTKAEISRFQKSVGNEEETLSPQRSISPARVRRQTSRSSIADSRRAKTLPWPIHNSPVALREPVQETSEDHEYQKYPDKGKDSMKLRRPLLDPRRRSKSAVNLNDLNSAAEQMCSSLRAFRERIDSAASEKLSLETATELENELNLSLLAMSERAKRRPLNVEQIPNDALDAYLARIIDERLALRERPGNHASKTLSDMANSMSQNSFSSKPKQLPSSSLGILSET